MGIGSSTMQEVLDSLGVHPDTLTQQEKDQLDRDGFLPLSDILTPEHVSSMRNRVSELLAAEGDQAGIEVHQEAGTDRLSDLVNKSDLFDICFTHPRVLAGMSRDLVHVKACRQSRPEIKELPDTLSRHRPVRFRHERGFGAWLPRRVMTRLFPAGGTSSS